MGKRAFHNLDAVIRDLIAATTDEGEGYERLLTFCRIIADIIDVLDDTDLPDTDTDAGGVGGPPLDLRDSGGGRSVGSDPAGHGPGRPAQLDIETGLDPQVGHARATELANAAVPGPAGTLVRAREYRRLVGGGT